MNDDRNVNDLLQDAADDGVLSPASSSAIQVIDLNKQIGAALGVQVNEVLASRVTLITIVVDDSGSIAGAGNEAAVRKGYNWLLKDVIENSKDADSILISVRYLNGHVLYPYKKMSTVDKGDEMTASNYAPGRTGYGTPLYDQMAETCAAVIAKTQEFVNAGIPVKTVTIFISDGADMGSYKQTPQTVKSVVKDMLRQDIHLILGFGVSDGITDFGAVYEECGLLKDNIKTFDGDASGIRRAFGFASKSAIATSQSASPVAIPGLSQIGVSVDWSEDDE